MRQRAGLTRLAASNSGSAARSHNPRSGLHNPVMLPYRLWPPLRFAGKGEKERREPIPRRLSRPRPQCGFSSAQLLPAVAVVVAGRRQGGLSRAGEHRRPVRPRGAQPKPGDEASQRGVAQGLREARNAARLHPLQRIPARQVQLPVLRLARGSHLRSSIAALARRAHDLDQRGRRLLALQSQERQSDNGGGQDVAVADAVPADRQSFAPQRPALSAELSARELARLSLLGQRTAAVSAVARRCDPCCALDSQGCSAPGTPLKALSRRRRHEYTSTNFRYQPSGEAPWTSSPTAAGASQSKSSTPPGCSPTPASRRNSATSTIS